MIFHILSCKTGVHPSDIPQFSKLLMLGKIFDLKYISTNTLGRTWVLSVPNSSQFSSSTALGKMISSRKTKTLCPSILWPLFMHPLTTLAHFKTATIMIACVPGVKRGGWGRESADRREWERGGKHRLLQQAFLPFLPSVFASLPHSRLHLQPRLR